MTVAGRPEAPTRVAVIGAGQWGQQHARVFSSHPDAALCAVVARHRERAEARAAQWGTRAYTSIGEMLSAERPGPRDAVITQRGAFRSDAGGHRGRRAGTGGKATGLRPGPSRRTHRRGCSPGLFFRHQLQPPLRRARPKGEGSHRRRRTGRTGICHLAIRRRTRYQLPPARQPDRDSVPRPGHARVPVRAGQVGHGPDDEQDPRRLLHPGRGPRVRQRGSG